MIRRSRAVDLMVRIILVWVIWLAPGSGRAQVGDQRPVLGEGASQMDAPVPGRAVTPGQDTFLYPPSTISGAGDAVTPRPLTPLPSVVPIRPLGRTPPAITPAVTSEPASGEGSRFGPVRGRLLGSWVDRPDRGFSHALVLSSEGMLYHWIHWTSIGEYYYLFDRRENRYLGAYDRVSGRYRPLDTATHRRGQPAALPVPVPSEPPNSLATRGSAVGDGRPAGNRSVPRRRSIPNGTGAPADASNVRLNRRPSSAPLPDAQDGSTRVRSGTVEPNSRNP